MRLTPRWPLPTQPANRTRAREGRRGKSGRKEGDGARYLDGDVVVSAQERGLTAGPEHEQAGHLDDARAA